MNFENKKFHPHCFYLIDTVKVHQICDGGQQFVFERIRHFSHCLHWNWIIPNSGRIVGHGTNIQTLNLKFKIINFIQFLKQKNLSDSLIN
jgi:hypothetical protein